MSASSRNDTDAAFSGRARFHRFTRRDRCPHCNHDGPCISFDNGDILCHREGEPGNWTDSFIGGYWHRAEDATADRPAPRRLPASPSTRPSAPINLNKRHAIVADLLKMCPLSEAQCVAHHLTEAQASRYGWLPGDFSSQAAIIAALLHTYTREELRGVPGFREQNGNIKIRGAGMMLPTRDLDGKIQAIDLRRDTVKDGQARYYKLSSRTDDDVDAPSPGAPPHIAIPAGGVTVTSVIGITEGVKKADYAADALGYPVISIPGIGSWRAASEVLERFAGSVVVLMLDQDDPAKAEGRVVADVERTRQALATTAFSLGYAVRLATWDHTHAKGIDDLLATGETFTIERYRLLTRGDDDTTAATIVGGDASNEDQDERPPRYGVPTLAEARALPHETLARRYVSAADRAYAGDTYLDLIGRVSKHAAVITPEIDPTAKRSRPVLTPTDRMCGVNAILGIRAASKGALSTQPVPMYRAAIAACGTSVGTASSSMAQLARVGILEQAPDDDEEGRRLYALPAIMPHDIPTDNVLAFDSRRRSGERRRACLGCGGTEFERTTRVRVSCTTCGDIITDKTRVVKLSDYDDDAAGAAAAAGMPTRDTPPVANCNTYRPATDTQKIDGDDRSNDLGVAICNAAPFDRGGAPPLQIATPPPTTRRQARIGDRAASHGHRASRDDIPRPWEPDDEARDHDPCDGGFTVDVAPVVARPVPLTLPLPPLLDTVGATAQGDDGQPTERCRTCKTAHYRWSDRWGEWVCATCWPPPLHIQGRTPTHDGGAS